MYRTTRLVSESRGHEEGEGPKEGVRSEKIMRRNENSMGGLTVLPRVQERKPRRLVTQEKKPETTAKVSSSAKSVSSSAKSDIRATTVVTYNYAI